MCPFGAANSLLADLMHLLQQQDILARMATYNQAKSRKTLPFWDKDLPQDKINFEILLTYLNH
jgi:hypothetical protein